MLSEWNKFVSKVYQEGKRKNANYKFKDALRDASARKGEMGNSGMGSVGMKSSRKSCMKKCKTMCKTKKTRGGKRSRGRGRSRRRRGGSHYLMPASFPDDANAP